MSYDDTADEKSPSAVLYHQLDASDWLPAGKFLASAVTVTVTPPGELVVDQCSGAGSLISYRVRGGIDLADYLVRFAFATEDGTWADDFTLRYPVRA